MANIKAMKAVTMAKTRIVNQREKRFQRRARAKAILKKIIKTRKIVGANSNLTAPNFIESLPSDIIAQVISRVASSSVADLFSCKISCKTLNQIGKEKYVIQQVGIENFNVWRLSSNRPYMDAALAYTQLCADCDNPGALFQQGMRQYFMDVQIEAGMKNLETAANLGHKTAAYALGLILICCGSEEKKHKGMELINGVKACTGKRIVDCRIRLREFLHNIWLHNQLVRECKPISFDKEQQHKHDYCRRKSSWKADLYLLEDEDDTLFCETCTCEFESKFFCWLFS